MKRIADYLQDNYAKKMPLAELANIAGVHPAYMARHFHKTYACTIGDYVRAVRVDRALADLLHSDRPVADIAADAWLLRPESPVEDGAIPHRANAGRMARPSVPVTTTSSGRGDSRNCESVELLVDALPHLWV